MNEVLYRFMLDISSDCHSTVVCVNENWKNIDA